MKYGTTLVKFHHRHAKGGVSYGLLGMGHHWHSHHPHSLLPDDPMTDTNIFYFIAGLIVGLLLSIAMEP